MKNQYEIRGEITAILLKRKYGNDLETLISTSDLEKVNEFPNNWFVKEDKKRGAFYVQGNLKEWNRWTTKTMHRWIFGEEAKGLVVDHIDGNPLNNIRKNLRVITQGQNTQNRPMICKANNSGVRGVSYYARQNKWTSQITVNGKVVYLGRYEDIREAEKVVVEARRKYMPYATN